LKGRDHPKDLGVGERLILKRILGKLGREMCTGFIWLRIVTCGRLLWNSNEPSGSIKEGSFLTT